MCVCVCVCVCRQTDRQAGRQAGRQTDRQTDKLIKPEIERQRQTEKLTDRQTERGTERPVVGIINLLATVDEKARRWLDLSEESVQTYQSYFCHAMNGGKGGKGELGEGTGTRGISKGPSGLWMHNAGAIHLVQRITSRVQHKQQQQHEAGFPPFDSGGLPPL